MNKKSGHWTNTGMAKFINDNLYNYDSEDEKSMNPFRWYRLQNGEDVSNYRETINGFPCRLILVNDGETPLNEGQNEPTPGNTKDMGIFNFNNDKDNVATLGFDSDIFPNCASYEVTANSDTSAGAFMSYSGDGDETDELTYLKESFELRHPDEDDVAEDWGFMSVENNVYLLDYFDNSNDGTRRTEGVPWDGESAISATKATRIACYNPSFLGSVNFTNGTAMPLEGTTHTVIIFPNQNVEYFMLNGRICVMRNKLSSLITVGTLKEEVAIDPTLGLKSLIDWVDNCTDEEFVNDFEEHFHKDYTLRYFCLVTLIGAVDNLGKNMMLDTADNKIFFPRFYDID